ncbi:hypothetical protein ACIBW9_04930 [Streptomyces sp. NPDC049541]|uniref:hypothetical protein n=1 Tax=Streptomyces sp. NPDC049541 TaxID=3365594 RepID=UPI0037AB80C8
MNTERPDNDAPNENGPAEDQGAVAEQGAVGAEAPGVTEGDADAPGEEAGAERGGVAGEDAEAEAIGAVEKTGTGEQTGTGEESATAGATARVKGPDAGEATGSGQHTGSGEETTKAGAAVRVEGPNPGTEKTGAQGEGDQAETTGAGEATGTGEESATAGATAGVEGPGAGEASTPVRATAPEGTAAGGTAAEAERTAAGERTAGAEEAAEVGVTARAEETEAAKGPTIGDGSDTEIHDATPDPDAEESRPSRRRSPVLIASVAAAVLLVGGGGAYLAASASGGSGGGTNPGVSGGGTTPPPLVLDGYSEGGTNGIAPGEPNPYGVRYKAEGTLPDGPDSAPVYRAAGEVTRDEVARLAKALGLDGTPVAQGQAWQVGPAKDGSGPSLVVDKQAPGTWTFHRYSAGTDACRSAIACTKDPANPAGATVSEAAAKKAAAPVLKAVGQDDAKVDASQIMGAQRVVNANPLVGGLPTYGWTTGLTVGTQGEVVGGSGRLKAPVKSDTYPVLGAQKTLDLMNAAPTIGHRMGIGGCASPVPLKDRLEAPCGQSPSGAGAKQTVAVDGAVFGLAVHAVDGRHALVPSWLFQVKGAGAQNGFTVTYPAVDPKYLASNSTTPSGQPTPSTTAPATRDVKVDYYTADGKDLTVSFTGGVCADYTATASESSDQVTVKVTETPWKGKICIMIAKAIEKTVHLEKPLGDRKVVGTDGKQILLPNPGQRLPGKTAGVQ